MAYTDFYMQTTGNNLNAGSTNADAAVATTTNGDWNSGTGVFIAASGTPFSATSIGDWVSIYLDAATVAVFIAQVTAVTSSVQITVSTTVKFGTAPTTGATGRSAKVGGAFADFKGVGTAMASVTTPVALRLNVKAGTYAHTSTGINFTLSGTTTLPVWVRGYKTTIGDMDTKPTSNRTIGTDIPKLTWTSGSFALNGGHNIVTSIAIESSRAGTVVSTGSNSYWYNCSFKATAADSFASCCSANAARFSNCRFEATTTATRAITMASSILDNCVVVGGVTGGGSTAGSPAVVRNSVFRGYTTNGISVDGSCGLRVSNCTFRGGAVGVLWTTTLVFCEVVDSLFVNCSTAAISNTSGTNTNLVARQGNATYNCTATESGFGDSPSFDWVAEASDPLTSSTDMTLVTGASSINGAGGLFFDESYSSSRDIGGVQKLITGSGGGGGSLILGGLGQTGIGTF